MRVALCVGSIGIFVAAIVWPAIALGWVCVEQGLPPRDGFTYSTGQFALLARTFLLAMAGVAACLPLATIAGVLIGSRRLGPPAIAVVAAGLLCPPMVFAFGWQRLLWPGIDPHLRCIMTWALWAWPGAALLIGAGWSRVVREPFHAAKLETSPVRAWLHIGLPAIRPHLFFTALVLFVLFFSDYGVPHGFGLRVYTTELLAWARESDHVIDVLWPALLPIAITALILGAILIAVPQSTPIDEESSVDGPTITRLRSFPIAFMAAGWLLPLLALIKPLTWSLFLETVRTYWLDMLSTVLVAGAAAASVTMLALGFTFARRSRTAFLFLAMLFGSLPGAVVGLSFIAAYNHAPFEWFYDHWPIVSLVYAARYGWIGLLIAARMAATRNSGTAEQARVDGATEFQTLWFVQLPLHAPLLVAGMAIIVALAVGDVAASQLVRVPGYHPIALLILDKFHQFQDGMLISLCIMLTGLAVLCAFVIAQFSKIRTTQVRLTNPDK